MAGKCFEQAKALGVPAKANAHTVALAKAAMSVGKTDEGLKLLQSAVAADHENVKTVALVRGALAAHGLEAKASEIVDGAVEACMELVAKAKKAMREANFKSAKDLVDEALQSAPENTAVLLTATQVYLLSMARMGLDMGLVERAKDFLARLDRLLPGAPRVAEMHKYFRQTLTKGVAGARS